MSDQAEGLRRLLAGHRPRVIAVAAGSPGVGGTTTVVNLAAALSAQGKDVEVIDEAAFLPAARGADGASGGFDTNDTFGAFDAGFARLAALLDGPADVVLIDVRPRPDGTLSPLALAAQELVLVTRVAAQPITDTYASLKRLHYAHAIGQFRVLVNHAGSAAEAQTAFDNLAEVAGRYLAVALAPAGSVAADPLVGRARALARCVVEAFPAAPAARDFRQLAAELQYWPLRPAMSWRAPRAPATVTTAPCADEPAGQHA